MSYKPGLDAMRSYFNSKATMGYAFRKQQLQKLKQALLTHETEIYEALYTDLKKSREEAYLTELGLVLADINLMLKNLKGWMKPETVRTNLVSQPSASILHRDPLGVILVIAPWNYPLQLSMMVIAGAIATGNCAVLKPSEFAPATAALMNKILSANFSKEYIQVIEGDGGAVVNSMMDTFRFDHLFYTGSIAVGKLVYKKAAEQLIPVTLELGGKSPCVVEEDANLEVAARRIAFGKFLNVGQTCIAPDYLLLHRSIKDAFIHALKKSIEKLYGAQPEQSYDYGRIINQKRFDTLTAYLKDATILHGGDFNREQLYIAPTIIENTGTDAAIMKEEIFGPILPVFTFDSYEEAAALIDKNPNPLAFYVFAADGKKQQQWIKNTAFGGGCINNTLVQFANSALPLGGVGNSGLGKYHGKFTFDELTRLKPVMKSATWIDPSIKYPPYKNKLGFFKRILG